MPDRNHNTRRFYGIADSELLPPDGAVPNRQFHRTFECCGCGPAYGSQSAVEDSPATIAAVPRVMKCPFCGFENDKVVDSRESKEADSIRRRRECLKCSKRFTTYERIDEIPYMVVKKDGRREKFDRQKVLNGLLRACEKRPVPISKLEQIVNEA